MEQILFLKNLHLFLWFLYSFKIDQILLSNWKAKQVPLFMTTEGKSPKSFGKSLKSMFGQAAKISFLWEVLFIKSPFRKSALEESQFMFDKIIWKVLLLEVSKISKVFLSGKLRKKKPQLITLVNIIYTGNLVLKESKSITFGRSLFFSFCLKAEEQL